MGRPDMSWSHHWRREGRIPLDVLQTELKRFVESYLQPGTAPDSGPTPEPGVDRPWSPPVDVYKTPDETVVVVELPGVDASQVELSVADGLLVIRGTRAPDDRPEEQLQLRERRFGSFLRQVPVASEVDFDAARAETVAGVLTIRLPRRRAAAPRTIPVRPG
jgi:HSP20 family protein